MYALGNEHRSIKFGLDRIRTVLDELGRPEKAFYAVHVAGTNGKGSTCAMIESGLREAGVRTGLYISPHLVQPTERIRIAGVPVSDAEFSDAFDHVHDACLRLEREGGIDMHTTYFETLTAMSFLLFRAKGVETAVLEVGMGGRLDATNVVDPRLAVITPIDFDHENYLGDTIPKIATEKAGIIKPGRPVVISSQRPEAFEVCFARARELNAPFIDASCSADFSPPSGFPLLGAHQFDNARTAATALATLGVDASAIERGLRSVRWPGRLEFIRRQPDVLLDGAHNPAGAAALAAYLERFHKGRRILIVFAAMHDKDLHRLGDTLFPYAAEVVFTAPDNSRAWPPDEMQQITGRTQASQVIPRVADALAWARAHAGPDDLILVTGSLYLVGEVRALLEDA